MRGTFFLCVLLISALIFSSCNGGREYTADEVMNCIIEYICADEPVPSCKYIYKKSASRYSRSYFSPELAGVLYYGQRKEKMWELELMSDYAVRLADGESGMEIHIFKVRARSDVDSVEKLLRKRLEYLKTRTIYIYTPDNYEKYIMGAQVYTVKNFVLLLSTPDNDGAMEKVKKLVR